MVKDRACQNVQPPRPALSVLIATYNRAALLDRTLRSLLEGVVERPDEIVIASGSCDRTPEVVAHHIAAGAPIRLIQVPSVGISASQNAGYPYCRGEIVATLDDDVIVAPDWVRRVKEAHVAYPQAGGIGGRTLNEFPDVLTARFEQARTFDVPGAGGAKPRAASGTKWSAAVPRLEGGVRPVRTVAGVNMSYKRAVMEEVGSFDESLPAGMDVDYNWRVARAGYPVLHDPSIVLTHHNRTSVGRMLRQQIWYGRGYFRTRRKWPDLPSSRIPRDVRGWTNWVKMVLFVVDPFVYHPLHYARRAGTPGDSVAFAVLACCADLCMKAGFLREAVGAYARRPRARQQSHRCGPLRTTPC
jgi:GT2 family glycosyltransferase